MTLVDEAWKGGYKRERRRRGSKEEKGSINKEKKREGDGT